MAPQQHSFTQQDFEEQDNAGIRRFWRLVKFFYAAAIAALLAVFLAIPL
jgi:anti-sigma-K factor RskA